jgi:hypothetical protein
MRLYHYTTFANFCSIWIQQKLKFSEWTNCNDVYERDKVYNLTQQSKEHNGIKFSIEVFRQFKKNVFEEVERYKQVSFCLDYKDMKGFASPMMWGHYARDYQRSGVCIEFDSLRLKPNYPNAKIYKGKVSYKINLTATDIGGVNQEKADAAQAFVIKNRKQLFFLKHPHWKSENEYRYLSKDCDYLDVSDAITMVYVLNGDEVTLESVKRIVMDTHKVSFLQVGGKSLGLNPMTIYDYDDLQETIRELNRKDYKDIWAGT